MLLFDEINSINFLYKRNSIVSLLKGREEKKCKDQGGRAHMGIPTISFKLPVRSWRPKCWMAIPEAWPDPNPTTIPLFTYVFTYQTTTKCPQNHSSHNKIENHKASKRGVWNITKTRFWQIYALFPPTKKKKNPNKHSSCWMGKIQKEENLKVA